MADDGKKVHNVCCKVTDRMLIDLSRVIAVEDLTQSEYIYDLIRRDLYGRTLRSQEVERALTSASGSSE